MIFRASPSRDRTVAALFLLALVTVAAHDVQAQTLASVGPASVTHNANDNAWTLANDAIALTVGFDRGGDLRVVSLVDVAAGRDAEVGSDVDAVLTLDGELFDLGSKGQGFTLVSASGSELANGVRLDLAFDLKAPRARVIRTYICYTDAPVIEAWSAIEATDGALVASDLNVWQLRGAPGTIRWLTGLQTDEAEGGSFTLQRRAAGFGDRFTLGAQERSSERAVPILAIERGGAEVFGGLMWSGAWVAAIDGGDEDVRVSMGLREFRTEIAEGSTFETPHGFFGVAAGAQATAAALARFALAIRNGRPFPALVTYNTWFAYGTHVDEDIVLEEMEHVAAMGAEAFVLDAGWYPDTGVDGIYDFSSGLGALRADEERFPSGLAALSDRAHELGMTFGIWVEPARTALSLVDTDDGPREAWLATRGGQYDPGASSDPEHAGEPVAAQICLAGAAGRRWLIDRLSAFIDQVHPDYLKWDNNFFLNCDREGHGHGTRDGNVRHNAGLYEVFAALRARFPDLVIENVSGGGNLLDFGALRYTDVAWMDDRSAPSAHVRHNLEGLSAFFPPAYLFSFVMGNDEEPMRHAADMSMFARSRMPGALGITFRSGELAESDGEELTVQIGMYKTLRDTLRRASAVLLSAQAGHRAEGEWDVLQERAGAGEAIVFAYQQPGAAGSTIVRPVGLREDAIYAVDSIDRGALGEATGLELMEQGIEIVESPASAAHILTLRILRDREPQ